MQEEKTISRYRTLNTQRIAPLNRILEGNCLHLDTLATIRNSISDRKTISTHKKIAQTQTKESDFDVIGQKVLKTRSLDLFEIKSLR